MGLHRCTEVKPDPTTDATTHAEWAHKDQKAFAQITLTLKDKPFNSVLFATTAKECWDKLSERYEGKGEQKIVLSTKSSGALSPSSNPSSRGLMPSFALPTPSPTSASHSRTSSSRSPSSAHFHLPFPP